MNAEPAGPFSAELQTGPVVVNHDWVQSFVGGVPLASETVELMLHGRTSLCRGRFLGNGFWVLEDGQVIGGGCVVKWRH